MRSTAPKYVTSSSDDDDDVPEHDPQPQLDEPPVPKRKRKPPPRYYDRYDDSRELQWRIQQLEATVNDQRLRLDEYKSRIRVFKQALRDKDNVINQLQIELSGSRSKCEALERHTTMLQESHSRNAQNQAPIYAQLSGMQQQLSNDINRVNDRVNSVDKHITRVECNLSELGNVAHMMRLAIDNVQHAVQDIPRLAYEVQNISRSQEHIHSMMLEYQRVYESYFTQMQKLSMHSLSEIRGIRDDYSKAEKRLAEFITQGQRYITNMNDSLNAMAAHSFEDLREREQRHEQLEMLNFQNQMLVQMYQQLLNRDFNVQQLMPPNELRRALQ